MAILDVVRERFGQSAIWGIAIGVLAVVIVTASIHEGQKQSSRDGKEKVPRVHSSWIPFIGNAPQMIIGMESYLAKIKNSYSEGIFSLSMFGSSHHFIHHPGLATSLLNKPNTTLDGEILGRRLLQTNFGFTEAEVNLHDRFTHESYAQLKHMTTDPGLSEMVSAALREFKRHAADFVTFNSYPADQADWEQLADAKIVENSRGEAFVEADWMELLRNFMFRIATPAVFGTDFVENFPDIAKTLWVYDDSFVSLMYGTPSWIPWPKVQRGRAAKRALLACTTEFHEAMEKYRNGEDPGARWQDMDSVSRVINGRVDVWRKNNLPINGRAASDLALFWAANANANPLTAWMILEISRDPVLLEQIREEIAPYVVITQPKNEFGPAVWVPPEIEHFDLDGLLHKCPLLKSAYVETLRLYTGGWSLRYVNQDVVVERRDDQPESFKLKKGTWVHVPSELHHLDPEYFPNPQEWHAARHIKETIDEKGEKKVTVDLGTTKPYGKL